jgi:hypothetical protein
LSDVKITAGPYEFLARFEREKSPRVQVGMCVLGCRACVNGSITLNHLIDKELPESGPFRWLRIEMIRHQAAHSLVRTREVTPLSIPHAWHRSRP